MGGEKAVPDRFTAGDHVYIAAMLRVKHLPKKQEKKNKGRKRKRDNEETKKWCSCKKPQSDKTMIECGDPACTVVWWHLDCVGDAEYELAEEWDLWICERCWKKRCVEFFAANPRVYTNGIGGFEQVGYDDMLPLINRIRRKVDVAEACRQEEEERRQVGEAVLAAFNARQQTYSPILLRPLAAADSQQATGSNPDKVDDDESLDTPAPSPLPAAGREGDYGQHLGPENPVGPEKSMDTAAAPESATGSLDIRKILLRPPVGANDESQSSRDACGIIASQTPPLEAVGWAEVDENVEKEDPSSVSKDKASGTIIPPALPRALPNAIVDAEDRVRAASDDLAGSTAKEVDEGNNTSEAQDTKLSVANNTAQLDTEAKKPSPRTSADSPAAAAPSYVVDNPLPRSPLPGPAALLAKPSSPRRIGDQGTLELSAQLWTTDKTKDSIRNNREFIMKYKYDEDLPSNPNAAMFHVYLPTCPSNAWEAFDINVETLAESSFLIGVIVKKFGLAALEDSYMHLRNVSQAVVTACLSSLKGGYLFIKLPPSSLSDEFKAKLLQYTHFAHVLNIPRLMRAAMHALCTTVHSSPMKWVYDDAMVKLLDDVTFEGNPARNYLSSVGRSNDIKAEIGGHDFPCDQTGIVRVCRIDNARWRGLWNGEGRKLPRYPVSNKFLQQQAALKEQATVSKAAS